MHAFSRPRARSSVRIVGVVAACLVAFVATACEPPPPPDGRDLGITLDAPLPATVLPGTAISVTGTLTNHGSVAADGIRFNYAITSGFVVDAVSFGSAATCAPVSAQQISCTIADPLAPAANLPFTLQATAGAASEAQTHVVAASSNGTEPVVDAHPNVIIIQTQVQPQAGAPVPLAMGGPHNFLGTGPLVGADGTSGFEGEDLYLAVSPYCTDKVNGDRYQSATSGGTCGGTANEEYRSTGYQYDIDVPEGRTSSLAVRLWDARYSEECEPGALTWSEWRKANGTNGYDAYTPPTTLEGPGLRYWDGVAWIELGVGESATAAWWQTAHRKMCGGADQPVDDYRQKGLEPFTFTLFSADNTPLDDLDNPVLCTRTFAPDTPFDGYTFLGSARWNTLCSIPASAPSGRYFLRVRNAGAVTSPKGDGSNQFGIVASYASAGTDPAAALCDRRVDALCPQVSGAGTVSVKAQSYATVTDPYLAEVPADAAGKVLKIALFDPGEGGRYLRIKAPTGPNSWAPVTFTWSSPGVSGSPGTTANLPVQGNGSDRFNGRVLEIEVDLTGYTPPAGNQWWKVEYEFNGVTVTDRTTWDAVIVGAPPPPLGAPAP